MGRKLCLAARPIRGVNFPPLIASRRLHDKRHSNYHYQLMLWGITAEQRKLFLTSHFFPENLSYINMKVFLEKKKLPFPLLQTWTA